MNRSSKIELMKRLSKKAADMAYKGDSTEEIYQTLDRICMMKMIGHTARKDYVETAMVIGEQEFSQLTKQYKIDEMLREEQDKEIADKSTNNTIIESATPASLTEAIKEAHDESKGKD